MVSLRVERAGLVTRCEEPETATNLVERGMIVEVLPYVG